MLLEFNGFKVNSSCLSVKTEFDNGLTELKSLIIAPLILKECKSFLMLSYAFGV